MLDIKMIRDDPAAFKAALSKRGFTPADAEAEVASIIALDGARRENLASLQKAQERRNAAAREMGLAMASGDRGQAESLLAEMALIKDTVREGEARERETDAAIKTVMSLIPNVPHPDVPDGDGEGGNVEIRSSGIIRDLGFAPKEHFDLGEAMGLMDFEGAGRIAGSRFTVLKGQIAHLERALGQFMLDLHTGEHGYMEVQPPLMVRDDAMFGTGQLPKFSADLFRTTDGRWLIPTAEVPLTNLVANRIVDVATPLRMAALTPCFRSEAGAAGRDQRGMLRQHQFHKVEMVSITEPDAAAAEHERMTACAEEVLTRLGLPFRTMLLCTGDMGFGARKTYDIEVWLPGQGTYREISSCSDCGDFQARRMNARCRPGGGRETAFVHTLNGSGVAVGRALIAVMENYQNEDGSVTVPDVLRPYMGGATRIG